MNIMEDAKKILQHILEHIIRCGLWDAAIRANYHDLTASLGLENENYCKICVGYILEKGYAKSKTINGEALLSITASGIDFIYNV